MHVVVPPFEGRRGGIQERAHDVSVGCLEAAQMSAGLRDLHADRLLGVLALVRRCQGVPQGGDLVLKNRRHADNPAHRHVETHRVRPEDGLRYTLRVTCHEMMVNDRSTSAHAI